MAIDPVNWRREMKKFIGAEISNLRAEIKNLSDEVHALRADSEKVNQILQKNLSS